MQTMEGLAAPQFLFDPFNNPVACWEFFKSLNQKGSQSYEEVYPYAQAYNAGITKAAGDLKDNLLNFLNVGLFLYKQNKLTKKDFEVVWVPSVCPGVDVRVNEWFSAGSTWASTILLSAVSELVLDNPWAGNKDFPEAALFVFESFMQSNLSRFGLPSVWQDMLWCASQGDGTVDERVVKFCQFFERHYGVFPTLKLIGENEAEPLRVKPSSLWQGRLQGVAPSSITTPPEHALMVKEMIEEFYFHRVISEFPLSHFVSTIDQHAFKQRLEALWQDLQNANRGLLPFGYDSISLDVPFMQAAGINEFKLFPLNQHPNARARFMSVRSYDLSTVWDWYDFTLNSEYVHEALSRSQVTNADLSLFIAVHSMWLLLVSEKQQQKTQSRINQPLVRVPLKHLSRIVRPMFKQLPEGRHRTLRAETRSQESGKGIPPEGKTFARTDFDAKTGKPVPARDYKYVQAKQIIHEDKTEAPAAEIKTRFAYTSELLSF